jgi:cellulose synthase/poly-beta-1,6-N-acetylglucosamine synthase-like glycosyltransferase
MTERNKIHASIIIAVRGDRRVQRCLAALASQTVVRESYEIIVVENGTRICENICREAGVTYLTLAQASMPAARNRGLYTANGNVVLFTDADCVASSTWIEKMLACFERTPDVVGVGGTIERYAPATVVELYGSNLVNGQRRLNYLPIMPFPYIVMGNAGFRRKSLIEIGGFDEELLSGNDVDICYKLGLKGYKISLCLDAIVSHENRKSIRQHFKRFFRYGTYQSLLFKKYQKYTRKTIVFDLYPFRCFRRALVTLPRALRLTLRKDWSLFWSGGLLVVEGAGIFFGLLYGSIKFRTLYL